MPIVLINLYVSIELYDLLVDKNLIVLYDNIEQLGLYEVFVKKENYE